MAQIHLQNTAKTFSKQPLFIVEDIIIEAGSIVWLKGPSGIGKSTLLSLVAGLVKPDAGSSIRIAGSDVHNLAAGAGDRYRADNISFIFQTFNLLPELTVIENLLIHARFNSRLHKLPQPELRDQARAALDKLNLSEKQTSFTDTLSQGEKQRVAIATALLKKSPVILADEPTSSLDPDNSEVVKELLVDTAQSTGATLLWVSHDHELLTDTADIHLNFVHKKNEPTQVIREVTG